MNDRAARRLLTIGQLSERQAVLRAVAARDSDWMEMDPGRRLRRKLPADG